MTVLKRSWKERYKGGSRVKKIRNKTMDYEVANPFVAVKFQRCIDELAEDHAPDGDAFYALAYIVEEYSDEIAEDLAEADDDELKETVIEMENEIAEEREQFLNSQNIFDR